MSTRETDSPGTDLVVAPVGSLGTAAPKARPARPSDLAGVLTLSNTTLRVGESTALTLTVTNVTDRAITLPDDQWVGKALFVQLSGEVGRSGGFRDTVNALAPGESRTFSGSIAPEEVVGASRVTVRMVQPLGLGLEDYRQRHEEVVPGIAPVEVTVVPPGWHEGMPLDPTQGQWAATMSADSSQVADDGTVVVHARIRNLSDDVAKTRGYGSLAIMCQTAVEETATLVDHVVDPLTMAPGTSGVFSVEFDLEDAQAHGVWYAPSLTRLQCSVGMKFDELDDPYNLPALSNPAIESDTVVLRVTHPAATSTSAPADA